MAAMLALAAMGLAGCGPSGQTATTGREDVTPGAAPSTAPCPDGGPRLPESGVCAAKAASLIQQRGSEMPAQEGCEWVIGETAMPGDEFLLYRAAKCGEKTTRFEFAGGARSAELNYVVSAFGIEGPERSKVATIISAEEPDVSANLLAFTREAIEDPARREKCAARKLEGEGLPEDGWEVNVSEAELAKLPQDEIPPDQCGPYGASGDTLRYWRVFGGFAWFMDLGQDMPDYDPGTFTLVSKEALEAAAK